MARAPLLQLTGISLTFGGTPVFDDLSLTVQEGDRVALVGRNGSGKSTLSYVLSGRDGRQAGLRLLAQAALHQAGFLEQQQGLPVDFLGTEFLCYLLAACGDKVLAVLGGAGPK